MCLAASLISVLSGVTLGGYWNWRLGIPYSYSGDALSTLTFIKGIVDTGWVQVNPYLGAPHKLEMYDYPLGGDNFNFLIMKVIAAFTDDPAHILNLFFLVTFALVGATGYATLRWIGASRLFGLLGAVIFAVAPYHYFRGVGHLLLSAYYMVPCSVLVALWVYRGAPLLPTRSRRRSMWLTSSLIAAICVLLGGTGTYYAVFACVMIAGLGVIGALKHGSWRVGGIAAASFVLIVLSVVANQSGTLAYHKEHGPNPVAGNRGPEESEIYGLRVVQLVLPLPNHRVEAFRNVVRRYQQSSSQVNGESMIPLGTLASVGFVGSVILAALMLGVPGITQRFARLEALRPLVLLVVALLLIGTASGFAVIFNYAVDPSIRAWARTSIVIAFLSIALLVLACTFIVERMRRRRASTVVALALSAVLLGLVYFDQQPPPQTGRTDYVAIRDAWLADSALGQELDKLLPSGAKVYQLPYVAFPESPPHKGQQGSYENARGYLHTHDVKWSFAAMRGRDSDVGPQLADTTPTELPTRLRGLGFDAIWIDRSAFADEPEVERHLNDQLGKPLVADPTNRFVVYEL